MSSRCRSAACIIGSSTAPATRLIGGRSWASTRLPSLQHCGAKRARCGLHFNLVALLRPRPDGMIRSARQRRELQRQSDSRRPEEALEIAKRTQLRVPLNDLVQTVRGEPTQRAEEYGPDQFGRQTALALQCGAPWPYGRNRDRGLRITWHSKRL